MTRIAVIGCSLNASSNSQILATDARDILMELGAQANLIDLRQYDIAVFGSAKGDQGLVQPLADAVAAADAVLLAVPIYNFDVNAAAKNLVEHTGSAWEDKIVGFMCSAGGQGSYMSVMGLANSLMLDFHCLIVPRYVYATGDAFADGKLVADKVRHRLRQLCQDTVRLSRALKAGE